MNSREALDTLEAMAGQGQLRRISSDSRLTKGIRYETRSGQQLQLELGNAVASLKDGRLRLADIGQQRATVVLENDAHGHILTPAEQSALSGVEYRKDFSGYGGSHYADAGSKLTLGRQACFYVDTAIGLRDLIKIYERYGSDPLTDLKRRFLKAIPDFESAGAFAATSGRYYDSYRKRVDALLAAAAAHPADGWAVMRDVLTASQGDRAALPPFFDGDVSWRVARTRDVDADRMDAALDLLVGGVGDPPVAIAAFTDAFQPLLEAIGQGTAFRDTRVVPATVLAAIAPDRAISVRYTPYSKAERLLNNRTLFRNKPMTADEYQAVLALAEQIRGAMIEWDWAPRDLWDVHGFILEALKGDEQGNGMTDDEVLTRFSGNPHFRAFRDRWSPEQTSAFCTIARAVHDAGFDWYHTNMPQNPVRFGRKPDRQKRAWATIGYLDRPTMRRVWFNDDIPSGTLGINAIAFSDAEALAFADALRQHAPAIAAWESAHASHPARWPDESGLELGGDSDAVSLKETGKGTFDPTNLILYGPPGTGKTYATAEHAVRLCGEDVPTDRETLMTAYRRLSDAGRIEFVTFHQSMAYEEFVEGLRPRSVDEDGQPLAAGFRLAPADGIFRIIARRAEMSTGPAGEAFLLGDRQVFKMSIGDATKAEWAWLFDEAIAEGYAYLGFGDIDWSDARFADREAILAAVQQHEGPRGTFTDGVEPSLMAGPVKSPDVFRNAMKIGDVIVVSKGLSLFRAIGVVEGPYEYAPRGDGHYSHRRKVHWLWHDEDGVAIAEINARRLSIDTIYRLGRDNLNVPALERYANSQQDMGSGTPEPFVLVIDEINRANISKVFGELITLLEPDKRIGKPNELRLKLPYSKQDFGVPANLHIVGTMNTADRSIALIDKALRRRFTFVEMMPDYDVDGMDAEVDGVTLADVLRALNDRIEYLLDREHQIGHAWLLGCDTRAKLDAAMRDRIIPLIAEYFFEDWGRTADVLGGRVDNPFLAQHTLLPPPGLADAEPRVRWSVRATFAADAYRRLIG